MPAGPRNTHARAGQPSVGAEPGRVRAPDNLPSLTAIRGVAAWWVVLYHFREYLPSWLRPAVEPGFLAVDFFFILSGFIIAYNYITLFDRPTVQGWRQFMAARIARIYPLHLTVLLLYLANPIAITLASSTAVPGERYDPTYYVLSLLLIQNWGFTDGLAWNVPAWSISTEFLAYLVFPLLAWTALRCLTTPARALLALGLALTGLAAWMVPQGISLGGDIARLGASRCVIEFFIGMCVFLVWFGWRDHAFTRFGALAIGLLCAIGLFAFDLPDALVMPLGGACLIYGLANRTDPLARLFSSRVLERIGLWSYSTYLVHYFVRDWVKFLLIRDGMPLWIPVTAYLVTTALASIVLFHWVEEPGRRAFRRWLMPGPAQARP